MSITRLTVCILAFAAAAGCSGSDRSSGWPLPHLATMPDNISVDSGTKFRSGDVPCRLLGIKESANPTTRERAAEFARLWFKKRGQHYCFRNHSNPLVDKHGTCIVCVSSEGSTRRTYLNEDLVQAGLVEIDEEDHPTYAFTVLTKGPKDLEKDWRGGLRQALEKGKKGELPDVGFVWPASK